MSELDDEANPRNLRIITWKDADQNLVTLAASILNASSLGMRANGRQQGTFHTEPPVADIPPGFMDSENPHRGFWTFGWSELTVNTNLDSFDPGTSEPLLSALCWYSFQNLIRQRMTQAREEIFLNLFPQNKALRMDKSYSRNIKRVRDSSKFGREKERRG